jgi:hypothetical protein
MKNLLNSGISSVIYIPFTIPVPRIILSPNPLQYMQMSILSSKPTCDFIPETRLWLRSSPLQHMQMRADRGVLVSSLTMSLDTRDEKPN